MPTCSAAPSISHYGGDRCTAGIGQNVSDGSKAERFRPSKCFPVCTSKQTQGVERGPFSEAICSEQILVRGGSE